MSDILLSGHSTAFQSTRSITADSRASPGSPVLETESTLTSGRFSKSLQILQIGTLPIRSTDWIFILWTNRSPPRMSNRRSFLCSRRPEDASARIGACNRLRNSARGSRSCSATSPTRTIRSSAASTNSPNSVVRSWTGSTPWDSARL